MTPVLQGFTGHVPPAFVDKNPGLKSMKLTWMKFSDTYMLDWEEPVFTDIGKEFIHELTKEYGTDHLYAIDQFIEMRPYGKDTSYLKNMSRAIYEGMEEADTEGIWVLQTWPFAIGLEFWDSVLTKAYFEGVPDDRLIALELHGEQWKFTGWNRFDGWYGKPWIWCILSNFGDRVNMFGDLPQMASNLQKARMGPGNGNLSGLGLINEGLDYNPVMYEYVTDMIWEEELPDLDAWKERFLRSRYGRINENITAAWKNIFEYYYTKARIFEKNPINNRPQPVENDIWPSEASVRGIQYLMNASEELQDIDAYRFDVVNLLRQVMGQYGRHLLYEITTSYKDKDLQRFEALVDSFICLSGEIEELLATREEFLLGKWISDSRERATTAAEEQLYEWGAKEIITCAWHLPKVYGYALKDWAGMYSSYYLPRWTKLFEAMRSDLSGEKKFDPDDFTEKILIWEDQWVDLREENIISVPQGNPVVLAGAMWKKYGPALLHVQ